MNERRNPLTSDEPKYRKKSQNKGLSRSKHKHVYETVLLHRPLRYTDPNTGGVAVKEFLEPTKMCSICNKVDGRDDDPSYYDCTKVADHPHCYYERTLSEKALNLPNYYLKDFCDKFAIKKEEMENV